MGRFLTGRGVPAVMLSACQLAAGAALMALALPFGGLTAPTWRADAVAALLILGIAGTGLAYVLNYRLIAESLLGRDRGMEQIPDGYRPGWSL